MKLYHKQLNSVADLRREQKRLKRKHKKQETPPPSHTTHPEHDGVTFEGILHALRSSTGGGGSMLATLQPLLLSMVIGGKSKKKSLVSRLLKEVLGGYVKWKSIDLTYTLVKRLIQKRQNKSKEPVH